MKIQELETEDDFCVEFVENADEDAIDARCNSFSRILTLAAMSFV